VVCSVIAICGHTFLQRYFIIYIWILVNNQCLWFTRHLAFKNSKRNFFEKLSILGIHNNWASRNEYSTGWLNFKNLYKIMLLHLILPPPPPPPHNQLRRLSTPKLIIFITQENIVIHIMINYFNDMFQQLSALRVSTLLCHKI